MRLDDLVIDWNASLHNNKSGSGLIAVGIKDTYKYDGNRRTDEIIGYTIDVVDTMNRFEKTSIKVLGLSQKPFEVEKDEYVRIYFKGLTGKVYTDFSTNVVKFSISADDVEILDDDERQ